MAVRKPLVVVDGVIRELPAADTLPITPSWADLVMWPSASAGTATVSGQAGAVRSHTRGGVTYYRFIPTSFNPALDGFYSGYTGGVLSGLLVSRG
jgi:hypothetical protein